MLRFWRRWTRREPVPARGAASAGGVAPGPPVDRTALPAWPPPTVPGPTPSAGPVAGPVVRPVADPVDDPIAAAVDPGPAVRLVFADGASVTLGADDPRARPFREAVRQLSRR